MEGDSRVKCQARMEASREMGKTETKAFLFCAHQGKTQGKSLVPGSAPEGQDAGTNHETGKDWRKKEREEKRKEKAGSLPSKSPTHIRASCQEAGLRPAGSSLTPEGPTNSKHWELSPRPHLCPLSLCPSCSFCLECPMTPSSPAAMLVAGPPLGLSCHLATGPYARCGWYLEGRDRVLWSITRCPEQSKH